jgi:hypothetical protein
MGSIRNITKELEDAQQKKGAEHRRYGRLHCLDVQCDLGPVVNISAAGLRVRCRHKPIIPSGQPFAMEVSSTFGRFRVGAQLAWIQKCGWFKYEVGLELIEVGEQGRQILGEIARSAPSEAYCLQHSMSDAKRAG